MSKWMMKGVILNNHKKNVIPDEMEVQIPLIRSEVIAPKRKKAVKSILKNKPKKRVFAVRKINKLVSTVETLINRREEEQAVNMVIERRSTLEPTLSRDDLRNWLNQTRQEKGKRQERIREDGRQERTQTAHHVSTSRALNIHSRHNDSRKEERSSRRHKREEESRCDSTKHSALSKSEKGRTSPA